MKLWKISQTENTGWDTYDSAIVAAEDEAEAKALHPDIKNQDTVDIIEALAKCWKHEQDRYGTWCKHPDQVTVEYIGEAKPGTEMGIIVASFNAG